MPLHPVCQKVDPENMYLKKQALPRKWLLMLFQPLLKQSGFKPQFNNALSRQEVT